MGEIAFIHLSDIHFRKSSGNRADIDADLRNAILMDIKYNAKAYLSNVKGILVGGDVAFAGQREEYDIAKEFLKEMASILEIDEKSIYCVPGNHDVDQQFIKSSKSILDAQSEIEKAETLDSADLLLERYILDQASPNLLFKSIEEYNNFVAAYGCNINSEKPVWIEEFKLDNNLRLKICGMNSCIISSHKDHEDSAVIRKMIIGQSQIPFYEDSVIWVSLCHHPVEFWKFADELQSKLDKRIDIQLYGHKHEQAIEANAERLVISAGATHPTRGKSWKPRYNWISFECVRKKDDRFVEVKTFPRVLSKDRDKFEADRQTCDAETNFFKYEINIDEKRRKNLQDDNLIQAEGKAKNNNNSVVFQGIEKEIVYNFFELSYVQQNEILLKLNLFRNEYAGKRYIELIDKILVDAKEKNCLYQLNEMIKQKIKN